VHNRILEAWAGLAFVSQAVKEQFMKDHRIHCDELLAFEAVYRKAWSIRIVEFCELLLDQIQSFHSAAVVVFVMTDDRPF